MEKKFKTMKAHIKGFP